MISTNTNKVKWFAIVTFLIIYYACTPSEASWLIYHKPEFKGRVVDIDTKKGAVVVAIYYKSTLNPPAGSYSNVIHVKETLTGKNGRFSFPSYTTFIHPLSYSSNCNFIIYKPGYGNLGKGPFEDHFSGKAATLFKWNAYWNNSLVIRYLTDGSVEIPRLTSKEEMKKAWMNAEVWGVTDINEKNSPPYKKLFTMKITNILNVSRNS